MHQRATNADRTVPEELRHRAVPIVQSDARVGLNTTLNGSLGQKLVFSPAGIAAGHAKAWTRCVPQLVISKGLSCPVLAVMTGSTAITAQAGFALQMT